MPFSLRLTNLNPTKYHQPVTISAPAIHRLDTVGRLWPLVQTSRLTAFFRISVELNEPIVLPRLQKTLEKGQKKFSGFFMVLKPGFFWSYVDEDSWESTLVPETPWPCMAPKKPGSNSSLLRVKPWMNRIAFEFSHALTDGTGAWIFIRWIIGEYLGLPEEPGFPENGNEIEASFDPETWENGFRRYGKHNLPFSEPRTKAYRPSSSLLPPGNYRLITGIAPTPALIQAAKKLDLKLGEFLVAILLAALQELVFHEQPESRSGVGPRVLRILVPVDLRKYFPSKTLRNFFAFVAPELDLRLGRRNLDEIAHEVRWQMRGHLVPWRLLAHFSQHIKKETNPGLRIIPGFIKRFFLVLGYPLAGENKFSASLSNLGKAEWGTLNPNPIRRVLFAPPPSPWTKTNCSVISSGDETAITFGSTARSRDLEREFFRLLVSTAHEVRITGGTR